MKIYHKKNFFWGILMLILAGLSVAAMIRFGVSRYQVWAFLITMPSGLTQLLRSLSYESSKEDRLEKLDEREEMIRQRAWELAYRTSIILVTVLMFVLLGVGEKLENDTLLDIGLGMAVCFAISVLADLGAQIYCQRKY